MEAFVPGVLPMGRKQQPHKPTARRLSFSRALDAAHRCGLPVRRALQRPDGEIELEFGEPETDRSSDVDPMNQKRPRAASVKHRARLEA
jgi:hypothetical protein